MMVYCNDILDNNKERLPLVLKIWINIVYYWQNQPSVRTLSSVQTVLVQVIWCQLHFLCDFTNFSKVKLPETYWYILSS